MQAKAIEGEFTHVMLLRSRNILRSTIFLKVLVALTGLIMIGFLVAHMLGNLQIFEGAGETVDTTKINEYAELLRYEPALLWAARVFLLLSIFIHIVAVIILTRRNRKARPQSYAVRDTYASAASRMMFFGGLTILLYLIYHILHFTLGEVHTDLYVKHNLYRTMIRSFQNPWIVGIYIAAQFALFAHLYHGAVSLFLTLGVNNPRHVRFVKIFGIGLAVVITVGFISVPAGVWFGVVS